MHRRVSHLTADPVLDGMVGGLAAVASLVARTDLIATLPAAATTTKTTRALLARTGKIHGESATLEVLTIELANGCLGFINRGHLNKAKAF